MPTFGFSAYLKLISLSPKRQRYEIKSRLSPSKDGYDFHRSLKLITSKFVQNEISYLEAVALADEIKRAPEKKSAKSGLKRIHDWLSESKGEIISYRPVTYESPTGLFKVQFTPDLGIKSDAGGTAIHLWNTATPDLVARNVYAALSLFLPIYEDQEQKPDDLALLSLRNSQFYQMSEAADHSDIGEHINKYLEEVFRDVIAELGLPKQPGKGVPPHPIL